MRFLWIALLLLSTLTLAGCEVVGDIFQAGLWVGAILVVLLVGGIAFVVSKLRG